MKADGEQDVSPPGGQRKQELLRKIRLGFDTLLSSLEGLDDEAMIEPDAVGEWSIKDHLAHIAAWQDILLRFHIGGAPFDSIVGLPGARYRVTSYDEINDHLQRRDQGLTLAEAKSRLTAGHRAVIETLERLTEEELLAPRAWLDAPEGPSGPLAQYVASNTYEHYTEHLATIQRLTP